MTQPGSDKPLSDMSELLDVIIVGGGPAGLSAALVLGRCRRRTILFDAGHPRNEASRAMHGYLSRDGISPAEFLKIGREQLGKYDTIEIRSAKVTGVERGDCRFTVKIDNGEQFSSRMLLLATGLVDELPKVEGFRQFYGVTAHNCPYCDGWEHRDQPLAVLGCDGCAAELALELLLWSKDVVLCSNGAPECNREVLNQLKRNGVRIIDKPIKRLEGTGDKLERIRFEDGSESARTAIFFSPGQHQRSLLAEQLGCEFCDTDGCIQCSQEAVTNVPGVYAAGNATRGVQLVIAAAAEGMQAAFAINTALLEADAERGKVLETSVAGEK